MKKKLISIVLSGIIICTLFSFTACGNKETPAERIELICGIELPDDMEVEYNYIYRSVSSTSGQYTIFKLKEEPVDFLSNYTIIGKMGTTDESSFDSYLAGHVTEEHYPKWENDYVPIHGLTSTVEVSSITVLYFPDILELIFLIKPSG